MTTVRITLPFREWAQTVDTGEMPALRERAAQINVFLAARLEEAQKVCADAIFYGVGFSVNGAHVPYLDIVT